MFARRFLLGKHVGDGPGTRVWRAIDEATGESRAVKFLSRHIVDDPDQVVRTLWDLIEKLRKTDHPGIVVPDGAVAAEGRVAIIAPWIDGETLEEKRRQQPRRRFPYESIRGLVCTWAELMGAAEKHRIAHGALKPANLMLDHTGALHVTDFMTGAWIAAAMSRAGRYSSLESSLPYWSPAQIDSGGGSYWRDDAFAFGAIIYELLTGKPPFPKRKPGATRGTIPMPALINSRRDREAVPAELEQVVMVCLDPNPIHRPASFRRIRQHLDPLAPLPTAARQGQRVKQKVVVGASGHVFEPPPPTAPPPPPRREPPPASHNDETAVNKRVTPPAPPRASNGSGTTTSRPVTPPAPWPSPDNTGTTKNEKSASTRPPPASNSSGTASNKPVTPPASPPASNNSGTTANEPVNPPKPPPAANDSGTATNGAATPPTQPAKSRMPLTDDLDSFLRFDSGPALSDSFRRSKRVGRWRLDDSYSQDGPVSRLEPADLSPGWSWLLKILLVLVALGLIAVAAAFAWIVTGHELAIPGLS